MIGFIGLGDLGQPMALRLIAAGHPLTVWNRTPGKAATLAARGGAVAADPADLFARCSIVVLCLTSHETIAQIAEAMLGSAGPAERRIIVDCSTGCPEASAAIARRADAVDVGWVDAPVSGGPVAAADGALTMFVGGKAADIAAAAPVLDSLASHRTIVGAPGSGQAMKLCNQMIVAGSLLLIAEAIATARRAGVDAALLPEALRGGFADSAPLQLFGPRMAGHIHTPRFGSVGLMRKDIALAEAMAHDAGVQAPLLSFFAGLYAALPNPEADLSRLIDLFEPPPPG